MEQATNQFKHGLQMDTHPMVQGNESLTDALNATFVTMNGNEVVLQNDMGNRRVDNAFLPPGYEPVGMKEYGGIIYIAAYNPITNRSQVGSFPSPERKLSPSDFEGQDLQAEFNFDNYFYGENNIEYDETYGLEFLKNDSFLIPLTKDTNLHVGDKFTVYAAGLSNMKKKDRITNYENTITVDGKNWVLTPKNKEFTLQLGILNSQNEFVDITKSLARWKASENNKKPYITKELVFGNEESIKVIKVDSNTTISLTVNVNPNSKLYSSFNGNSWSEFSGNIIIPERITKLYLKGQNITVTDIRNTDFNIKEWNIVDYTNESELYKFNDGYFIPDEFTNPTLEETKKDAELIKERQTFATNTYAYKLIGPLYLKVTLNHIQSCDYSVDVESIDENQVSLLVTSNIKYNCPDGTNTSLIKDSIGEYYTRDLTNPNFEQTIKLLNPNVNYDNYIITTCNSTLNYNNLDLVSNFTQESDDNENGNHYGRRYLDSQNIKIVKDNNNTYYFRDGYRYFYINTRNNNNKCSIIIITVGSELESLKLKNNSITEKIPFIKIKQIQSEQEYYYIWGAIIDYNKIEEFHEKQGIIENDTELICVTNGSISTLEFRNSLSTYIRISNSIGDGESWTNIDKYFYGNVFGEFKGKYILEINSNTKYITNDDELTNDDFYPIDPEYPNSRTLKTDLRTNQNYIKTDISSFSLCYDDPSIGEETNPNTLLNTLYFPIDRTIENKEITSKFQVFDIDTTSHLIQIKSDFRAHHIPDSDENPELTEIFLYKLKEKSFIYNNEIQFYKDKSDDIEIFSGTELQIDQILVNEQEYPIENSIIIHTNDTYILKINESEVNVKLICQSNEKNPEIQLYNCTNLNNIISSERIIENINYDYISNLYYCTLKNKYIIAKGSSYLDVLLGIPLINKDKYLRGNISKISVNLDLVKTGIVNIYHWSTFWKNQTLQIKIGINNYNEKPITALKFFFKKIGGQNSIEFIDSHVYDSLSNFKTIYITNILESSHVYIIEKIQYKFNDSDDFYDLKEYQNKFDEYGNKSPIKRWVITTDLFNEFYNDIDDYCTLYKTRNVLVDSFKKKMELDFKYSLSKSVDVTEDRLDINSQTPYTDTKNIIKIQYPEFTDQDKRNLQLEYLNNYPIEIQQILENTFIDIDNNSLELSDLNMSINGKKYQLTSKYGYKQYTVEDINKYQNNNEFLSFGNEEQKEKLNKNVFTSVETINNNKYIHLSCNYVGDHTTPNSSSTVRYYDPISKIIKYLGPECNNGKYACLIPDTHERGGDDYHYLIVCLQDTPQGEVKGYSEAGTEQYQYLDRNKYYRENDGPEVFYYSEAIQDFTEYLNNNIPEDQIYTYIDMKNIKAFNYDSNGNLKYYYFEFIPRLLYLKDKSTNKWYISKTEYPNLLNKTSSIYFLSHDDNSGTVGSPDYKSDNKWAHINSFDFELFGVSTITLKFNENEDPKSVFSYGTLDFKIKDFTNVSNFNININYNEESKEKIVLGNTLINTIKPSPHIEYKIWDSMTDSYKNFNVSGMNETNIHKLLYEQSYNNFKIINNFYVYVNHPEHKININGIDFNTFVYDFSNSNSQNGAYIGNTIYYGLAYYNDTDSITKLWFTNSVKNGDIEY